MRRAPGTARARTTSTDDGMSSRRDRPRPVIRGAGPIRGGSPGKAPRPAILRPGARLGGPGRRTPRVRRASAGLTPVRAAAMLVVLGLGRRDLRRERVGGVRRAQRDHRRRHVDGRRGGPRRARRDRWAEPVHAARGRPRAAAGHAAGRAAPRRSPSGCPRRSRSASPSASRCSSGWSAIGGGWSMRRASCSRA